MIYTKRKNLHRYLGQSESLDTAIRHVLSADLTQLAKGRNEIDGDRAFINRFDYQTMTEEQASQVLHAIRPRIFYPYHYGQVDHKTDLELLGRLIADLPDTEMRIRPME